VHHIHHLCSRIPYYRLPDVLREHPELVATGRLTLFQSLRCVRLVLWDEDGRRLISFRDMGCRYIREQNRLVRSPTALHMARDWRILVQ